MILKFLQPTHVEIALGVWRGDSPHHLGGVNKLHVGRRNEGRVINRGSFTVDGIAFILDLLEVGLAGKLRAILLRPTLWDFGGRGGGEIKTHFTTLFGFIVPNIEIFGVIDHVTNSGRGNTPIIGHCGSGVHAHHFAFDLVFHLVVIFGHDTESGTPRFDGFGKLGGFTNSLGGGLGGGAPRFGATRKENCGRKYDDYGNEVSRHNSWLQYNY